MPSSLWLKILDDFIFDQSAVNGKQIRSLYDGSFIKKCTNLIFVGGTGKGKTHLSIAIAAHAVKIKVVRLVWTGVGLGGTIFLLKNYGKQ